MQNTATSSAYGYVKDGKVYLRGYLDYADRQIGEVKTTDEMAISYFINRFAHISGKVDKLLADIEQAQNKGSYLMKLIHMRTQLASYDALGDFIPLFDKLEVAEAGIRGLIVVNRVKNLEIKTALLQEARELLTAEVTEWKTTSLKVKELREKWLKTGSVDKDHEELEDEFSTLINQFYERRRAWFDERQRLVEERVGKYEDIVRRAKALLTQADRHPGSAMKELKRLQDEWREVGPVPKNMFVPLITEVKRVQKTLQRKGKFGGKPGDRPRREVIDPKELEAIKVRQAMINEAKALQSLDLREAYGKAKDLQSKWRLLPGEVQEKRKRALNDEFTYVCDRIFEMSYLMRSVYIKYRFFNTKPLIEQYAIKIQQLKEIIVKDEQELVRFVAEYNAVPEGDRMSPTGKQVYGRMKTQERKLKVKNILLSEMQQQMEAL